MSEPEYTLEEIERQATAAKVAEYLYDQKRGAWGYEGRMYRRKSVPIQAVQWTGDNLAQIARFATPCGVQQLGSYSLLIQTVHGGKVIGKGGYVARSFRITERDNLAFPVVFTMTQQEFERTYEEDYDRRDDRSTDGQAA